MAYEARRKKPLQEKRKEEAWQKYLRRHGREEEGMVEMTDVEEDYWEQVIVQNENKKKEKCWLAYHLDQCDSITYEHHGEELVNPMEIFRRRVRKQKVCQRHN